jgi:TetR/AcrR family transcriptional regulator, transcriptional repressor for nem operon
VLREAAGRGDLGPSAKPDDLAEFILNSYEGALLRSKADRSDLPLKNFLHSIFIFGVLLKK